MLPDFAQPHLCYNILHVMASIIELGKYLLLVELKPPGAIQRLRIRGRENLRLGMPVVATKLLHSLFCLCYTRTVQGSHVSRQFCELSFITSEVVGYVSQKSKETHS
jgi:uncharacterized membrane protein